MRADSHRIQAAERPALVDGAAEASVAPGRPGSQAASTPSGVTWPPRTQDVRWYGTVIRLTGPFADDDLAAVRTSVPGRQVTRDGDAITIWPAAARQVTAHHHGLVILRGDAFDTWSVRAVRAAHPGQFVSHDGDAVTVWPTTVDPTQLAPEESRMTSTPPRMTSTPTRARRAALAVAAAILTLVGTASCIPTGDKAAPAKSSGQTVPVSSAQQQDEASAPAQTDGQVLASVDGESDLTLRITAAQRGQGGRWLTVRGTITNNGSSAFYGIPDWRGDWRDMPKSGNSVAGASIVDEASMKRYYVLRDTTGLCLCTTGIPKVEAGKSIPFTAQFPAPPASSTELGFQLPTFPVASIKMGG
jgi:hypothetical protein